MKISLRMGAGVLLLNAIAYTIWYRHHKLEVSKQREFDVTAEDAKDAEVNKSKHK